MLLKLIENIYWTPHAFNADFCWKVNSIGIEQSTCEQWVVVAAQKVNCDGKAHRIDEMDAEVSNF